MITMRGSGFAPVGDVVSNESRGESLSSPIEILLVVRPRTPFQAIDEIGARPPQLTRAELAAAHGAAPEDLESVARFAAAAGLTILESDAARRIVRVSGPIEALATAFQVDLADYQLGKIRYRAHMNEVGLPGELAEIVTCVLGLDTRPLVQPAAPGFFRASAAAPAATAAAESTAYYATQVSAMYGYPTLPNAGQGQTIGLIELAGGYIETDIDAYFAQYPGQPPRPEIINVGPNVPSGNPFANIEVTMDVELAGSVCPYGRVVVYNAGSETFSIKDYFDIFAQAVHDTVNDPAVLSSSWFFPEDIAGIGPTPQEIEAFEALFKEAALLGITICCASGDQGGLYPVAFVSSSGASVQPVSGFALPVVNYPPSSPLVLSCGGTTIAVDAAGALAGEIVWNRLAQMITVSGARSNNSASGGGVSRRLALPDYQLRAQVPPAVTYDWTDAQYTLTSSFQGRGVPDVCLNADMNTGYRFFYLGAWAISGGTSAAAPMWATLVTLFNQVLGKRLGLLNPWLYQVQIGGGTDVLRRIVRGNNGTYEARPDLDWNACTGLGSPDGTKLLAALTAVTRAATAPPAAAPEPRAAAVGAPIKAPAA
jgi:kumamolisin